MPDIIGLDKIVSYMGQFDFKKIKLSKGTDVVFVKRVSETETQADLVNAFQSWVDDFVEPNNNQQYKLELMGSYSPDPQARLTPVVKVSVAFYTKDATHLPGVTGNQRQSNLPSEISIDKYVSLATENAKLEAQLERLEEKMDELLADDEDDENVDVGTPQTLGEAVNSALIGKLDTIVDVVLAMLMQNNNPGSQPQIAGVTDFEMTMGEFRKNHPDIDADIIRLYKLSKMNPGLFDGLVKQLRIMVNG